MKALFELVMLNADIITASNCVKDNSSSEDCDLD